MLNNLTRSPAFSHRIYQKYKEQTEENSRKQHHNATTNEKNAEESPRKDQTLNNFTIKYRNKIIGPLQPSGRNRFQRMEAKTSLNIESTDNLAKRREAEENYRKMMKTFKDLNKISNYHDKRFEIAAYKDPYENLLPQDWNKSVLTNSTVNLLGKIKEQRTMETQKDLEPSASNSDNKSAGKLRLPPRSRSKGRMLRVFSQDQKVFKKIDFSQEENNSSQKNGPEVKLASEQKMKPGPLNLQASALLKNRSFFSPKSNATLSRRDRPFRINSPRLKLFDESELENYNSETRLTARKDEGFSSLAIAQTHSTGFNRRLQFRTPKKGEESECANTDTNQKHDSQPSPSKSSIKRLQEMSKKEDHTATSGISKIRLHLSPKHKGSDDKIDPEPISPISSAATLATILFRKPTHKRSESNGAKIKRRRHKRMPTEIDSDIKDFIDGAYSDHDSNSSQISTNFILHK